MDEWVRAGLRDVVIAPGSRSTPLALAFAARDELRVHVRLDERGAGFFALGRALITGSPVAVVVTSGTAAAELHASVAEADLAEVPLLVLTADRPPELHGVGAPQTMDQRELYGTKVRRFEEPGVADAAVAASWRPLASRLWLAARGEGGSRGPVHLNAAFVEPLVADPLELPEARAEGRPWRVRESGTVTPSALDVSGQAVLAVVGARVPAEVIEECRALGWAVVGDATARGALPYADPLLRSDRFAAATRPDVVVRLGGLPASKYLAQRLIEWGAPVVALGGGGSVADPDGLVSASFEGWPRRDVASLVADVRYAARWRDASDAVGQWLAARDAQGDLNEPLVARAVVERANASGASLVIGSSMPVRDVEWWAAARTTATFANRGANGIDGVVSTAFGVAAGASAIALVGDLTMLHDVSGLVDGLGPTGGRCVVVVADNRGGGIFSFLSQRDRLAGERFEQLFGTPRPLDLEVVAAAFGHGATTVTAPDELRAAIDKGLASEGVNVVVARVPSRDENVALHAAWNDEVALMVSGRVE